MPNARKIIKWIILIGCNLYIVVALGFPLYHDYTDAKAEYQKLDEEGIEATAKVTRVQMYIGSKGRKKYEITYTFEANGVPYTEVTWANTRRNKSLLEGDVVQVRYATSDPQISEIIGNEENLGLLPYKPLSFIVLACSGALMATWLLVEFIDWRLKRAASRKALTREKFL